VLVIGFKTFENSKLCPTPKNVMFRRLTRVRSRKVRQSAFQSAVATLKLSRNLAKASVTLCAILKDVTSFVGEDSVTVPSKRRQESKIIVASCDLLDAECHKITNRSRRVPTVDIDFALAFVAFARW
jgi:hypothetical protein